MPTGPDVQGNYVMDTSTLIDSKIFLAIASLLSGIIITVVAQRLLHKRGLFTYRVFHNLVALSAEDAIYGSVKVTWNDKPVRNLYLSAVELINESMKDFDFVIVRVCTNNTLLPSETTKIVGTTRWVNFTDEYRNQIAVAEGSEPTDAQFDLFRHQRDYLVPTMNRGQMLRFQYLNVVHPEQQPAIWVEVLHKGVKCKFQVPKPQFLGVAQTEAAFAGTVVGLIAVVVVIIYVESLPVAALLSFLIGWLVLVPGAYTVKAWRHIRGWLAD
jgi:hypothetical protein